ncbi:MAG: Protein YzbB [uncultured Sphingomonadaceae bacterium]|uniref:Protein YzbB n=1 Tax=uncultured Sphingomonadaceae bacterium TaxID=169976 RepID=A0A6J4TCB0_9SPHN|nr:MAG: Protein YzbB [uncultured Sphingomonadaceae bacterium]
MHPRFVSPSHSLSHALALLVLATGSARPATLHAQGAPNAGPPAAGVVPGVEVLLSDSLHLLRGKRVGLITNQSAVTRSGELGADVLARTPGVQLVALFGPEHGIRGNLEAGATFVGGRDTKTGVVVHSLYDRTQRPTAEELANVDVLVFDIQDIGARVYTFVWTMAMAMEEAAKRKIPFVVLDRPNPITAALDGPVMDIEVKTVTQVITGYYTVPLRHGMTAGEIARYYNADAKIGADLHVVPVEGWRPDMWFEDTGLRFVPPSPNIRSVTSALNFTGLVLGEATNVHVGRGTEAPFNYVGAPWLDANRLRESVAKYNLPGVRLTPVQITPTTNPAVDTDYKGQTFTSLRLDITDRRTYRPAYTALVLLSEAKKQNPAQFRIKNTGFTQMLGSHWARAAFDRGDDPREIDRRWQRELAEWDRTERAPYRLYR